MWGGLKHGLPQFSTTTISRGIIILDNANIYSFFITKAPCLKAVRGGAFG
jgi:hypothetical protein